MNHLLRGDFKWGTEGRSHKKTSVGGSRFKCDCEGNKWGKIKTIRSRVVYQLRPLVPPSVSTFGVVLRAKTFFGEKIVFADRPLSYPISLKEILKLNFSFFRSLKFNFFEVPSIPVFFEDLESKSLLNIGNGSSLAVCL